MTEREQGEQGDKGLKVVVLFDASVKDRILALKALGDNPGQMVEGDYREIGGFYEGLANDAFECLNKLVTTGREGDIERLMAACFRLAIHNANRVKIPNSLPAIDLDGSKLQNRAFESGVLGQILVESSPIAKAAYAQFKSILGPEKF